MLTCMDGYCCLGNICTPASGFVPAASRRVGYDRFSTSVSQLIHPQKQRQEDYSYPLEKGKKKKTISPLLRANKWRGRERETGNVPPADSFYCVHGWYVANLGSSPISTALA